ncbi:hypothetical protein ACTWJ9_06310 [Streptomyces sp. GDS52]|uniref:hypothetical protein n=1 Tax=Streptomyces TaxID=1883 RepID=UPI003C705973
MSEPSPGVPEPVPPPPGTTVLDVERDRVGVVMGHAGPYLQLRPLSGGREWDASPERVRPLTAEELFRARLAEANARSRTGLRVQRAQPPGEAGKFC